MKLKLLMLSLVMFCQLSAQDKRIVYIAAGKSMTETEYNVFKSNFKEKAENEYKNGKLKEIIKDSITSDTIYKLCTLSYTYSSKNVDKEFVESFIDKKFPFFEFDTMESSTMTLKDFEGKPTLINLWFVGCAPCMRELPALEDLKLKYGDKVNFVSITFNNKELVKRLLNIKTFNYTHLINAQEFLNNIGVNSYPKNILLDKNGIVRNIKYEIPYKEVIRNGDKELEFDTKAYEEILNKLL